MNMQEIGPKVAIALNVCADVTGGAFKVDEVKTARWHSDSKVFLTQEGQDRDFSFSLGHDAKDKRIYIRGYEAKSSDKSEHGLANSITVSDKKNAGEIAGDIARRFLPQYREYLARGFVQRDEHDAYFARKKENTLRIAEALGGTVDGDKIRTKMGNSEKYGYLWDVQMESDSVKLDFRSVPIDVALRILKAWKEDETKS